MYAVYTVLYTLALCALLPRVLWDRLRGGRYATALAERLGRVPEQLQHMPPGGIWIHAVSVGEVRAACGLVPHLKELWPDKPLVISTVTPTGQALARRSQADAAFYLPLDLPRSLRPYFEHLRPSALLLVETEIWPNLLRGCRQYGVSAAIVNGRLSQRSHGRYRWLAWLWPGLLGEIAVVCARTADDARRFRRLRIPSDRVFVSGDLKADASMQPAPGVASGMLATELEIEADEPGLVVAGCTMEGEDEQVLDAFARLRRSHPRARLLIAPRHPERFDRVAALIADAGWCCQRRTDPPAEQAAHDAEDTPTADVILLDTIGELPSAYAAGRACFVGGSLVASGGHNPLEPAAHARPVIFGPHMDNFAERAAALLVAGGARQVSNAVELAATWRELLDDNALGRRIGDAAQAVLQADGSAGARTARILRDRLPPCPAPRRA